MTYEKEIPAYALQVAKAPKTIPCQAIYHTEKLVSPVERQRVQYQFEEDILVPDIKEDMAEILFMDANCTLQPTERKLSAKSDDLLNLSGTIHIQTLYRPEKTDCLPVAITSKVPYQYQWHLSCSGPATGYFRCDVRTLEYMIINERKFRIKVTLEFSCQIFQEQEILFFQGLEQDKLEMKKEPVSFCCLSTTKKETVEIDAWVELNGAKETPALLLQQHYTITENYRQVTSEKIVLNGFLYTEFLYQATGEEREEKLCSQRDRMEFTQFLPLEKQYRGKKWSLVKTGFDDLGLRAALEKKEDGTIAFHVEGKLEVTVALYEAREQEMVTDAYHQRQQFVCKFQHQRRTDLVCASTGEAAFREVIHLPEGTKAEGVVCTRCRPIQWNCNPEKGRLRLTVEVEAISLWKEETGYQVSKNIFKLQELVEADGVEPEMSITVELQTKDCRLTLLGERQIELMGRLCICWEGSRTKRLMLLEEPGFTEGDAERSAAMVITAVDEGEDLWTLAKRYRTTEEKIRNINHLEGDLIAGQKLLIAK